MTVRFAYSSHKSRAAAERALEDYFATGEVAECEHPEIKSRKRADGAVRYAVEIDG